MKKCLRLAALGAALTFLAAPAFAADAAVAWPAGLTYAGGKVPAACAAFVQPRGWTGEWVGTSRRPGGIFVEKMTPASGGCVAIVIYAWGPRVGLSEAGGYLRVEDARVEGSTLIVPLRQYNAEARFTRQGGTLAGTWRQGQASATSTMQPR